MDRPVRRNLELPPLLAGMSVLVVDDQEANVLLLRQLLERAGMQRITTLTDARQALVAFEAEAPDLVLLDLHMPHVDGFTILEELRARLPDTDYVPVLVLTADVTGDAKQRALSLGANDFLTKPFDPSEVLLRVRNLLQTRFLHGQLRAQNRSLADEVTTRTAQLHASESARSQLMGTLERLQSQGSPEETANAICEDLVRMPEIDAAMLSIFTEAGGVVPLAIKAPPDTPASINRPLPASRAAYLVGRARLGPWIEESIARAEDGEYAEQMRAVGFGPGIYAPLRHRDEVVGILAGASLSSDLGADRLARLLPAVIDRAALAAAVLAPLVEDRQRHTELETTLRAVIEQRAFHPVFQPIVDLERGTVVGFEALTRFDDGTRPDHRFAHAEQIGLGLELERACLQAALELSTQLPDGVWLSLNVAPANLLERDLLALVAGSKRPVVLEVTEHVAIPDYSALKHALAKLRPRVGLAIDDAGAGFASFRHIIELAPEYVKLDIGLVRDIHVDTRRQALIAGMRYFAGQTGCKLLAEGIEVAEERATLRRLGVALGQGYLLGRPVPVDQIDRRRTSRPFAEPAA
jgi:EAL domain-containing protein (putative c-di-GMP-specific phosphodiesterase class I)/DNA-binding response OmpR family regulator